MPYKDPEKRKAHKEKWRKANLDKVAAYQRRYMKKWFRKNPRKSKAYCTKDWAIKKRELSEEDYREWIRQRNNKKCRKYAREKYARNKAIIDDYKRSHPCNCGEADIACLEFHHRDESIKKFAISAGKHESVEMLNAEMVKCDVLCKNCHTKLHNKDIQKIDYEKMLKELDSLLERAVGRRERGKIHQKRYKKQAQIFLRDYKIKNNCKNCEEEDPNCLIFHHRNPDEKEGKMPYLMKSGVNRVKREIDKCDLLCHNCHSKTHHIEDHPFKLVNKVLAQI